MSEFFYPVERLFANPRVFFALSNALEGPDAETLKTAFFDLMEYGFAELENPEDCEFTATEACFRVDEDGTVEIILDSGLASVLSPVEGEIKAQISNDAEMVATGAIYDRIVTAIVEANPEFKHNIALCSPPTPGNGFLRSPDGDRFTGTFHLLTNPETVYDFSVDILDIQRDILRASYKPTSNGI